MTVASLAELINCDCVMVLFKYSSTFVIIYNLFLSVRINAMVLKRFCYNASGVIDVYHYS